MAGSEADDKNDDHACNDRYNRLMYCSCSAHLEVIQRRQREYQQHKDDEQRLRRVQVHFCRLACVRLHGGHDGWRVDQGKGSSLRLLSFQPWTQFHLPNLISSSGGSYLYKWSRPSSEKTRRIYLSLGASETRHISQLMVTTGKQGHSSVLI